VFSAGQPHSGFCLVELKGKEGSTPLQPPLLPPPRHLPPDTTRAHRGTHELHGHISLPTPRVPTEARTSSMDSPAVMRGQCSRGATSSVFLCCRAFCVFPPPAPPRAAGVVRCRSERSLLTTRRPKMRFSSSWGCARRPRASAFAPTKQLRIVMGISGGGGRSRGRFATPADSPRHDCSPYSHVHARRERLGFVHRSRHFLSRRAKP
jgi:hypothetical protein